jgi:hypothetical protein
MKNVNFIEMSTFVSNNTVDIRNIDDFETLIQENEVKNVFFGQRTARNIEGNCFLISIDSMFYAFTYNSKYGVYINIEDYKNGRKNNFENAMDYYIYLKNNSAKNFNEYITKEYDFDRNSFEEKLSHGYSSYEEYIKEMMNIIFELELIKEKYLVDKNYAIIIYLLNKHDNKILIDDFMRACTDGIVTESFFGSDRGHIKIAGKFLEKWYNSASGCENQFGGREYGYNESSFKKILKNINDKILLFEVKGKHIIKK